jgi:hypothetical protein
VRRKRGETWESEVRGEIERLRQALVALSEQETAFDAGVVPGEQFLEVLGRVARTRVTVSRWWQEWQVQTADLKTSRAVALSVFRACVPALLGAVELYGQSLGVLGTSPNLEADGRELAKKGVRAAKEVSSFALEFIGDTPGLRPVDRAAVDATLVGLEARSEIVDALLEMIGSRVRELRSRPGG